MAKENAQAKRAHKATYAADKKKGGYLVRIIGPNATAFVGREVPVTTRDGSEHTEKLVKIIWSGLDTGTADRPGSGQPAALYTFESKPRTKADEIEF